MNNDKLKPRVDPDKRLVDCPKTKEEGLNNLKVLADLNANNAHGILIRSIIKSIEMI